MVLVWTLASPAPVGDAVNNLKVYSKLLLVLMLQLPFQQAVWQRRAFAAFTMAMALVLLSTYANTVIDLLWSHTRNQGFGLDQSVFVEYVSQSVMTAIFVAYAVHRAIGAHLRWQRVLWWLGVATALASVVFLLQGRSGLLATVVVAAVLFWHHTPRHLRWRNAALLVSLGVLLVIASPLMRERLLLAYLEVVHHQPFDQTSLGARIDMWRLAWETSWAHPVFGAGSGAYPSLAEAYFGHCNMTCTHPHNHYLFFSMEFGLPVLGAYLLLLVAIGLTAHRSTDKTRVLLWAWLAVVAIDGLFNVPLWYRAQSYFFYAMLALFLASNRPQPRSTQAIRQGDARPA
jgi:O-antigen ligase